MYSYTQNEMGAPPPNAPVDDRFKYSHRVNRKWFWIIIAAAFVVTVLTTYAVKHIVRQEKDKPESAIKIGGFFMVCHSC